MKKIELQKWSLLIAINIGIAIAVRISKTHYRLTDTSNIREYTHMETNMLILRLIEELKYIITSVNYS